MTKSAFRIAIVLASLSFASCHCGEIVKNVQGKIGVVYDEGGVRITQDDGTYDFDKVGMGVKKTLKMTITNLGGGTLTLESLEKSDGDAVQIGTGGDAQPVFIVDFQGTTSVSPGTSVDFDVTFNSPLEADQSIKTKDHLSQLILRASNAEVPTANITLKGTSVSGACDLPRTIDFGAVATGDAFSKTVTIENFSPIDTTVTVGDITSNSGDDKNFEFAPDSERGQFSLAAGKKKDVIYVFKPTEIKDYLALVKMKAADACPEITVTLIGSGVDSVLTWAPNPVDFGYVTPGLQVSTDVTFSNQGLAPITLTHMAAMAGAVVSNEYKVVGPDMVVVPAAVRTEQPDGSRTLNPGTAIVSMTFKPQILGRRDGALTAATTLTKQAQISVPLKGYGGGPDIDVRPSPVLNFSRVPFFANTSPAYFVTRKITIQNVGTKPTTPDAKANLRLGKEVAGVPAGSGPYWEVHSKAGTMALDSEICVGEVDASGACTNSVSNYDPMIGIVAGGAASLLDIPVRITPADANGNKEWELSIFSNDPDEAIFKITIKAEAVVLPPCNYTTTPTNLNFGLVTPPSYRDLSFAVHNLGANAGDICLLSGLDMKIGSNVIYSLPAGPIDSKELMPGETVNVLVRAWPQGTVTTQVQNAIGAVQFNMSSPTKPLTEVTLNASIATSCLTIAPDSLDFGTVKKDCFSARKEFNIYNTCGTAVTVNSFGMVAAAGQPAGGPNCPGAVACPEFLVDGTPGFSAGSVIPAGSSMPVQFALKYRPIDYGHDNGGYLIKVTQNGQIVDYIVTLQGTGDTQGLNTDVFRQDTKPKADILLIVDDSCSMSDKQAALAANFASFIKYATTAGVDYQIGVVTTDYGSNGGKMVGDATNPKILKPTTPNVDNLFKLKVNVGTGGGTEMMAAPATAALTAPVITSDNAGFLRVDAVLAVVIVSDAGDQSPQAATVYENQLRNVKGAQRASQFSYNDIGPFAPTPAPGCSYDDFTDVSKNQYLVTRFNGVKEEICAPNWSTSLESVGKNAFGYRTNFFLTAEPQGGTVQVAIDGITLDPVDARGAPVWNYDATSNSVNFQPLFVPEPGKTLTITYTVQCRTS